MALIQAHFFSEALGMCTSVNVILPAPRRADVPMKPLPVLTLLHGMGDDYTAWQRKTAVERYAVEAGLAVVIPDGGLSCYENMEHGPDYRDYMLEEMPQLMRNCFPLSSAREENFLAGCSMGGFAAIKLGFAAPEKWSVLGCFSAAHREYKPASLRSQSMHRRVYGDRLPEFEEQIERDIMNPRRVQLRLHHSCGDRDILKENVLESRDFIRRAPRLDYRFEILPGEHDWALWDEAVRRFIAALPLPKPEARLL